MRNKNRNKKKRSHIPTGTDRLSADAELMSAIKLFYSLGNTVEETARAYNISVAMVKYCIKKAKDFDNIGGEVDECFKTTTK